MPPKRLKIVEPKKPKKKVPKRLKIVEEKKIEPKKKPVKKKKLPKKLNIKPEKKKMVKKMPKRLKIVEAPPLEETHPELTAITGMTGVQANAMSSLALFGMLPKELGQMVLNPSQRGGGVKVGQIPISKFTIDDVESAFQNSYDFNSNMTQSMAMDGDWTEYGGYRVLTAREDKYYQKHINSYRDGNYDSRMEMIEQKIMEKGSTIEFKLLEKALKDFKKQNKGKTGTIKQFDDEFSKFWDNY